jgi:hypothetical protein
MADAFGASRVTVRPPERGVFPIDHDGECKHKMQVTDAVSGCIIFQFNGSINNL